jgi:hypothetical protein
MLRPVYRDVLLVVDRLMRVRRRCQKRDSESGQEQLAIKRFHCASHVRVKSKIQTAPRISRGAATYYHTV